MSNLTKQKIRVIFLNDNQQSVFNQRSQR